MRIPETTSQIITESSATANPVPSSGTIGRYRRRGFSNLLKMGHCAPSVMQTILDLDNIEEEWLVCMTAGLPGGIGSTGFECGGITSPLIKFGLEHGLSAKDNGLPTVIYKGHDYCQRFIRCNKSLLCKEILGKRRIPLPCIKVARYAPELYKQTVSNGNKESISGEQLKAFSLMHSHLANNDFHCAHAVLNQLDKSVPVTRELLDGTSGFIGGSAFMGLTCSAFTAGLMAAGIRLGEIENSNLRVFRMLTIMILGGNAFAENLNKFNRLMNLGHRMSEWFTQEFGSTQCREITKCDFSSPESVHSYIEKGTVNNCRLIAEKVAMHAGKIIQQEVSGTPRTTND
jgi:hypothetical protein